PEDLVRGIPAEMIEVVAAEWAIRQVIPGVRQEIQEAATWVDVRVYTSLIIPRQRSCRFLPESPLCQLECASAGAVAESREVSRIAAVDNHLGENGIASTTQCNLDSIRIPCPRSLHVRFMNEPAVEPNATWSFRSDVQIDRALIRRRYVAQ